MTTRNRSSWALALILGVGGVVGAQEPAPKSDPAPAPKTSQNDQKPKKVEPERKPDADRNATPAAQKPAPERKGGIQNVGAASTDDKGSTTNLGTDVAAVRQRIEAALQSDPSLKGAAFTINVTDDTVEITGVANNGRERTAARRIVQSFAGNLRVKDRISVAGVAPPSADAQVSQSDKSRAQSAEADESLAKPESDETQAPAKKANKPKKDPPKHGDQSEAPRKK